MKNKSPNKTSLGLEENIEGALAYLFGFLSGIALLLVEEKSRFVRFHALQSTIIFIGLFVVSFVMWFIPPIWFIIGLIGLVVWLVGMIKAYQGELYKFPVVGEIAEEQLQKMG
ncbi:hypothetical protein AKJ65_05550 [candidate division MSBL1 archaeon SCGC-AAA259E19]|uniref:Chloroplast import component protein (Tic20) n=1 Tax=candidate division MSBL1 archaeon SCGC-AAA259E19 TaxID=1698264 RepID=A0A133UJ01_9EURY|nr:hypothetical protein AKJ65_05550 [candidate division MSBL1 archaeon SCGC-AAA259E19]